ncbi:MAG: serine hydrolase [Erythrobacter sp.]
MIRQTIAALALLAAAPGIGPAIAPAAAQDAPDQLDARYDRALAAGYKALMLCSAIGNAEENRSTRTAESVHEWELSGIYPALDPIIRDLPFEIVREAGTVRFVSVAWADDMPPRLAVRQKRTGCRVMPIGMDRAAASANVTPSGPAIDSPDNPTSLPPQDKRIEYPTVEAPSPAMQQLAAAAFGDAYGEDARTTAILVLRDNAIEAERYGQGFDADTPQRTWSVAKSLAATFVGYRLRAERKSVESSAGLGIDESDPRRAITIDNALRMASGRYSDTPGNRTDPLYWGGTTVAERAQNWPLLHEPGTVYRYANNDTLAAVQALSPTVIDRNMLEFLQRTGMNATFVESDWQGNFVLSSQVWSTARDLARLGQLHLDGNIPGLGRVIDPEWRDYVSNPSGPQPEGTEWGYGAGWWTFRRPEGNAFEGIPDDAFAARGNRGQYVVVVPSRDIVIVRRGEDPAGGSGFDIAAFTREVLSALED